MKEKAEEHNNIEAKCFTVNVMKIQKESKHWKGVKKKRNLLTYPVFLMKIHLPIIYQ